MFHAHCPRLHLNRTNQHMSSDIQTDLCCTRNPDEPARRTIHLKPPSKMSSSTFRDSLSLNTGCRGHPCRRRCGTHRGFHIQLVLSPSPIPLRTFDLRAIALNERYGGDAMKFGLFYEI